jgi:ATP-dependent RNA helicase DeaD
MAIRLPAGREGTAITLVEPTRQPIAVEKLPTVADLHARRLELTRAALRDSLLKDDLDAFRSVVGMLGGEFDLFEVALAAVKLAHETSGTPLEEEDLPEAELPLADDRRGRGNGELDDIIRRIRAAAFAGPALPGPPSPRPPGDDRSR